MPLALVITELDVGGAEKALVSLATALDRRLWNPLVIALGPEAPMAAPLRKAGVAVACLDVSLKYPARAFAQLVSTLRAHRPTLIQSFLFHANIAVRLAAPFSGAPWVIGGLRVAEREKRWHLRIDRLTAPLANGSVCVSEGVRRFSREVGWPDAKLTVIPNAVEIALFDQSEAIPRDRIGVPPASFLALYVGRLNVQKGLHTLLDAAERVVAQRPDWHLALAGDGPERPWLDERLAANPIIASHVHPLGSRSDIPALLKTADMLVLPSLWEGMPNAILEAMAARRASVATAVEGTEDLIVQGETGWLVPPADPSSLAAALVDAASDPGRLGRYGEAAHSRAERLYSPAQNVRAYENLWAKILGFELPK